MRTSEITQPAQNDLAAFLDGLVDTPHDADHAIDLDDTGDALHALSTSIAGQYVDPIASYAQNVFRGRATQDRWRTFDSTLATLDRLVEASQMQPMRVAIADMRDTLAPEGTGRARDRVLLHGREAVLRFADCLDPIDGQRLRELVEFERGAHPLLEELSDLRGIGPRRLERLYCAGLFTVETVASASPEEIAAVTGIPIGLCESVVSRTVVFEQERRERVARELVSRAAEAVRHVRRAPPEDRARLQALIAEAVEMLRQAL